MDYSIEHIVTDTCNLSCFHCYKDRVQKVRQHVQFNVLKEFYSKSQLKHVYISGGEPFVYKDIKTLCDLFRKKEIPVSIQTNGTFLERLQSAQDFNSITISIDGCRKTHKKVRGVDNFAQLISFAEKNDNVMVNCVVQKANLLEIKKLVTVFRDRNIKFRILLEHFIFPAELERDNEKLFSTGVRVITTPKIQDASMRKPWEDVVSFLTDTCSSKELAFSDSNLSAYWGDATSSNFICKKLHQKRIRVSPDGLFFFCEHLNITFGDLRNANLNEVLLSNEFLEFTNFMQDASLNICKRCCKGVSKI